MRLGLRMLLAMVMLALAVGTGCRDDVDVNSLKEAARSSEPSGATQSGTSPTSGPTADSSLQRMEVPGFGTVEWRHEPGKDAGRICLKGEGTTPSAVTHAELWLATPSGPKLLPLEASTSSEGECLETRSELLRESREGLVLRFESRGERYRATFANVRAESQPAARLELPPLPSLDKYRTGTGTGQ